MKFIQFYTLSTGYVEGSIPSRFDDAHRRPIEACGDRGVVIVDGRVRADTVTHIAASEAKARGFIGYRVFEGRNLVDAKPVSGYWPITGKADTTAFSASHGA